MKKIKTIFYLIFLICTLAIQSCDEKTPTENENNYDKIEGTWISTSNEIQTSNPFRILTSVGTNIYVATLTELFESSNDGVSWQKLNNVPDSLQIISISGNKNILVIGTSKKGVFISKDSGENWTPVYTPFSDINFSYVNSVYMDSEYLYCNTGNDAIILRSSDLGETWQKFNDGLPPTTEVFYPRIGEIKNSNSKLYVAPNFSGIYYSENKGEKWIHYPTSGLPSKDIWDFAISESALFASCLGDEHGLYKLEITKDNLDWERTEINLYDWDISFVISENNVVIVSTPNGMAFSYDNGQTWEEQNDGLTNPNEAIFNKAIFHNNFVFVIEQQGAVWKYQLK